MDESKYDFIKDLEFFFLELRMPLDHISHSFWRICLVFFSKTRCIHIEVLINNR